MNRFATAMWDFSWATRRSGSESEYADWDKILDELADRGYDNVRIDAFPHLVAVGPDEHPSGEFVVLPQRERFMWGNHQPVKIAPRRELIEFMQKCKQRDISVGLSSWFIPDSAGRHRQVCTPLDFVRVWDETLSLIDNEGLIGLIKWVDLCNEFPLDLWAPGAAGRIFGQTLPMPMGVAFRGIPWPERWKRQTQAYLTGAIRPLKMKWPTLRFCYSFPDLAGSSLRTLDVSEFDVAEIHCWLTDSPAWNVSSLQIASLLELPCGTKMHARRMAALPASKLAYWLDTHLLPKMITWSEWASRNSLSLITTEGWGPTNYSDIPGLVNEWAWVRKVSEFAVPKAIEMGWTGICTSNFCQPHHRGMWADPSWHLELTGEIRKTGGN